MEFTGKSVEEATELGLKELGLTIQQVNVKIIEEPAKGLFGKVKGKAVVDIVKLETKTNNDDDLNKGAENAVVFVNKLFDLINITAKATLEEGDETVINIVAENSNSVIGYRGEMLDAIQTLAGAVANIGRKDYKKVVVNCENYREKREETLISLAHKLEGKAVEMRREVMLEPMSPYERRIIHTALSESNTVTTKSEGKEPNRYVIIIPNDKDEYSRPYNAGRNNNDHHKGSKNNRHFTNNKNNNYKKNSKNEHKNGNGWSEIKKKSPSGFGTFLGNSFKDND